MSFIISFLLLLYYIFRLDKPNELYFPYQTKQKVTIIAVAKSQKESTTREISRFCNRNISTKSLCASEHLVEKGCVSLIVNCSVITNFSSGIVALDAKN